MVIEQLSVVAHDVSGFMDGASPDGGNTIDAAKAALFLGGTGFAYWIAGRPPEQGEDRTGRIAHARHALAGMLHHSLHHRDL